MMPEALLSGRSEVTLPIKFASNLKKNSPARIPDGLKKKCLKMGFY
jgi:hypothetical protein